MTDPARSRQYPSVQPVRSLPGDPEPLDHEDFRRIYDREVGFVSRTVRRLGVAPGDVADAVHDVFVIVYRRWHEYDTSRPLQAWIFGIARKQAANRRRKQARERLQLGDVPSSQGAIDSELDMRCVLLHALQTLDEERRVAFILHDLEGYTGPEIAGMLDVPMNTVYSRVRSARERLVSAIERIRRKELSRE